MSPLVGVEATGTVSLGADQTLGLSRKVKRIFGSPGGHALTEKGARYNNDQEEWYWFAYNSPEVEIQSDWPVDSYFPDDYLSGDSGEIGPDPGTWSYEVIYFLEEE